MEAMTGTNLLDQFEILVNPGAYDAHPPIPVFRMDYAPRVLSVDRLTVAVYLLFRPWISGELLVSKPMTPQLAEAIRQYSGFVDVAVRPIELRALPIISGRNSARAVVVDLLQIIGTVPRNRRIDDRLDASARRSGLGVPAYRPVGDARLQRLHAGRRVRARGGSRRSRLLPRRRGF